MTFVQVVQLIGVIFLVSIVCIGFVIGAMGEDRISDEEKKILMLIIAALVVGCLLLGEMFGLWVLEPEGGMGVN